MKAANKQAQIFFFFLVVVGVGGGGAWRGVQYRVTERRTTSAGARRALNGACMRLLITEGHLLLSGPHRLRPLALH